MIVTRTDWNFIVLAAAGGRPLSPIQYQNAMFLVHKNVAKSDDYKFKFGKYGYVDPIVFNDFQYLASCKWATKFGFGEHRIGYAVTEEGMKRFCAIRGQVDKEVMDYIGKMVKWVYEQPAKSLVQAISMVQPKREGAADDVS